MKQIDLLFNIMELNNIYRDSIDLRTILNRTAFAISDFMKSTICSIYYYDEPAGELTIFANIGLDPKVLGLKISITEGLAGLALRESRPVYEKHGSANPNFKGIPGINEEKYDVYLALPIEKGVTKIGVLVLQRETGKTFKSSEIRLSEVIASNLALIIENAKLMNYVGERFKSKDLKPDQKISYNFIEGKSVSEGFHYSETYKLGRNEPLSFILTQKQKKTYSREEFIAAVELTEKQITELQNRLNNEFSEAASLIYGAHLLILKDANFTGEALKLIEKGENPPDALIRIATNYIRLLMGSQNEYIKEKAKDIEDITKRILENLLKEKKELSGVANKIIIASDLLLSDLFRLYSEKAGGIILMKGGATSHFSILARSMKIPVIVTDNPGIMEIPDSAMVLMNADTGHIYINPSREIVSKFTAMSRARVEMSLDKYRIKEKTLTSDGTLIKLLININLISEMKTAEKIPYEGVGLYRTEMPFLVRKDFPDEEEQFKIYRLLLEKANGKEVTFRTLDIGGDKFLPYENSSVEKNPFLGLRSIRFSLRQKDTFRHQIKAILRAGYQMKIRIMFPMISSIEEFSKAREIVLECLDYLGKNNIPHYSNPEIGMMVELPAVTEMMEDFCRVSDFFSIGTNDLIQYMLGVDRTNDMVADMYIAHHPSILRALNHIINTSNMYGKKISICGDMANRLEYLNFLIGCGIREISIEPANYSRVQQFILKIDVDEASHLARKILKIDTIQDIEKILNLKK